MYYNDLYANHYNVSRRSSDRWTASNPITNGMPRIVDDIYGNFLNLKFSDPTYSSITNAALMEDISYVRIKSISLSYSLNQKVLKPYGVSSLGFSLCLNNFFTFTNYSGIDPESSGAVYPITRSVSLGINLGF